MPSTTPCTEPRKEGLVLGPPEATGLELDFYISLKKGNGPSCEDSSVNKDNGPMGKITEKILWPLCHACCVPSLFATLIALQTTLNTTGCLWSVPVSSILGSKHQIAKILWPRESSDRPKTGSVGYWPPQP